MSSAALFHREYEAELEGWFQRRFGYLCVTYAALEVVYAVIALISLVIGYQSSVDTRQYWIALASSMLGIAVVSSFLLRQGPRMDSRPELVRAATWLILALGALAFVEVLLARLVGIEERVWVLGRLFLWHVVACAVLPWHPRESLRPMIPLLAVWAVDELIGVRTRGLVLSGIGLLSSPLVVLPGMAICAIRLSVHGRRFQSEMLGRQFVRMRRELSQARSLHESMFPRQQNDGHVRFEYAYQPARDVGGDFIHLHVGPTGIISVVVIDVTGHGVAAALTVNRLSGELDRIRAEHPNIHPSRLLALLNRYVHLTLSRHSVYATATAFDVDPYVGLLRFASAGHPPLVLRRASGEVAELEVSGMMLGAVGDDRFEAPEQEITIGAGDTVVAYTDGVFECANRKGEQLGLHRLLEAFRQNPAPGNWPAAVAAMVERHHGGRSQDDALITAVTLDRLRAVQARSTSDLTTIVVRPPGAAPTIVGVPAS